MSYKLSLKTEMAWLDKQGGVPASQRAGGKYISGYQTKTKTYAAMMKEFSGLTKEEGHYHISWAWKNSRSGHIVTAERLSDGSLRVYDPQNGNLITDFKAYSRRFSLTYGIKILRVDNLTASTEVIREVVKAS